MLEDDERSNKLKVSEFERRNLSTFGGLLHGLGKRHNGWKLSVFVFAPNRRELNTGEVPIDILILWYFKLECFYQYRQNNLCSKIYISICSEMSLRLLTKRTHFKLREFEATK